ncbi:DEAD/DEAH box helicase family protein [Planctomicrobium sp. SH668]|uniref:DEAD/DEAH box helicase family protein n=1 Tax=Planctomicrobium sp. SH668 TaxID=3448126 RepID=UPI003F5BE238
MASRKGTWWGHPTLFSLFGAAAEPEPASKRLSNADQPTPNSSSPKTSERVAHSGKNKQLRLDFTSSTAANQNGTLPPKPLTNGTPPKSQLPISKPPQQQKRLFDLFLKPLITPTPHKPEEGASSGNDTTDSDQVAEYSSPSTDRNQKSPPLTAEATQPGLINLPHSPTTFTGEKGIAQELIAAIRTLKTIETEQRPATAEEQQTLSKFSGFGMVALSIFPNPATGQYKSSSWQALGEELKSLLTPEEYDSAKRTTFNAFYTSPVVIQAMHLALAQLGIPLNATILEPGCGIGRFLAYGQPEQQFIGIELDSISGRMARALYPQHDIRIESFRDTRLPEGQIDAVIGNVPFSDLKLDHHGQKFSLHDYFFAKSVDALRPGGVLTLVTSHYTLDKQNASIREYLAERADFVGAIRLPSDTFRRDGTAVVTDIVFLRKRPAGEPANHIDPDWLGVAPLSIEGAEISINNYFHNHPEMVLGNWSRKNRLYGDGYSIVCNGDLHIQLPNALSRLPSFVPLAPSPQSARPPPAFIPPPPQRHIDEGSFFIGEDKVIYQSQGGEGVPVVYGGTKLRSDGTLVGRRMGALITLRDHARRVLQSQNEDWPSEHRDAARKELNKVYDRFVMVYGPINKTTFSETSNGTSIRRMPNLVKFREDPDAMLVMSLEEYDEPTGKATKAAILLRDVVGRTPPVTRVQTAEEGLLVALNQRGKVDLPFISQLYGKPESSIIDELGDLIFHDPQLMEWQTSDVYLSGNVREKLKAAEAAGMAYFRNVSALADVQPPDVLPGDIDANLGAPWIPEQDIQAFAAELFSVDRSAVPIAHLQKDAVWSLDAGYAALQSVATTIDYGTPRANGTWLLELALNMKSPTVYDTLDQGERVINQTETLAAREKQKLIKEKFRNWVFTDPDRTERLVRIYNDLYNNLRPRVFDGSHLDYPGMNDTVQLRPHQNAAVWRGMSSGNTLLAHCVGAGKTFTMAATGMKMKQASLIKKPMFVVPNHLLEQFSREFLQLYPNAKLLIAAKEDLTRDRRKFLTARIASGEWDGIIVTHSSFERIGMSRSYQEQFLREQIAEYDTLLCEHAAEKGNRRNLIKTIEKQKASREEKLKHLLAEEKKDDGLVFDELGVDHLFIDEAHYFKNLETPTKMDRVAGIQTGGSERAFDVYMKARYLDQLHAGHGVTFATGTPISNTMMELYTLQRFLDPRGLRSRGIEHFDAWAATFGEVVDAMEITPDGAGLRPRSRFAKFTNLPELQQMFRAFADVQTAEMLNLPRPTLKGDKPDVIACPMSDEQHDLQQDLVKRYERIRNEKIDPREDNALAITTDGRKLATDARMLDPVADDFPESKINRLVETVTEIFNRSASHRGTQMIFADMGVNPTAWGYSPYAEIIRKLTESGIPRDQIASIGDAESDAKKQALFKKVREGAVRILLGSTQKMGTGTNVQKRLVALHHLDAPWKPAEVEQRDGRILRQGNESKEVSIFRYVTEGSFDAYMWQALETKAKFINQVMTGDNAIRTAEDIGGQELSYAEVKAIASGNPAVLTLAEADAELQRLHLLKKSHMDEQFLARRNVRDLPDLIDRYADRLQKLTADQSRMTHHDGEPVTIGGKAVHRDDLIPTITDKLESLPALLNQPTKIPFGTYHGLEFGLIVDPEFSPDVYLQGQLIRKTRLSKDHQGPRAVLNAIERLASGYGKECDQLRQDLTIAQTQLRDYQSRLGKPFTLETYLSELTTLRDQLKISLSATNPAANDNDGPSTGDLARQINSLKNSFQTEAAPERLSTKSIAAEPPVTLRIRQRETTPVHELQHPARAI